MDKSGEHVGSRYYENSFVEGGARASKNLLIEDTCLTFSEEEMNDG
jgi:hypothetical protein